MKNEIVHENVDRNENQSIKANEMDSVVVHKEVITNEDENKNNVHSNETVHDNEQMHANKIKIEDTIVYRKDIDNKMDMMRNNQQNITSSDFTHVSVMSKGYSRLKEEKRRPEVPHVIKEYLHLTASIVKTKFPKIDTISSEQLIAKVQDCNFCDYYDMMMRIMKNEQMKLNPQNNVSNSSSSGFFTKFKEFIANFNINNDDTTSDVNNLNIQSNANTNIDNKNISDITDRNNKENQHLDGKNRKSKKKDATEKQEKSKKKG